MKYIRLFEKNVYSKFWTVSIENIEIFRLSLDKLNFPHNSLRDTYEAMLLNDEFEGRRYICIGFNPGNHEKWGWTPVNNPYYTDRGYAYMGTIEISDEDISQNKYNL